jgi:uncharacterized protein (DUF2141 family)
MHKIEVHVLSVITCLFTLGCAQVRSISGGEKDITPPTLLASNPENQSLEFDGRSFTLNFDEYIQVRDLQKELLVSPPLKSTPRVKLKQRSMEVSWDDTLRSETTYIFQFGRSIADVNESNILDDVSYVFSTGSQLDSLTCTGVVIDAFTDKPVNATKVLLFDSLQQVFNAGARPAYFARTNEKGEFRFRYLRNGQFALCALSDENGNNHFELGESIHWQEGVVPAMASDTTEHFLMMSAPRDTVVRGFNYIADSSGVLKFQVNRWLPATRVIALNNDSVVQWLRGDTLYATIPALCGSRADVAVVCGGQTIDTLTIEHLHDDFASMKSSSLFNSKMTSTDSVIIRTRRPIRKVDDSFLVCFIDSIATNCVSSVSSPCQQTILMDKKPGAAYTIQALPGWLMDDCGETNDTINIRFSVYASKELGSLSFKFPQTILDDSHSFLLMDKSKKPVSEMNRIQTTEWVLDGLLPGDYTAIICEDSNANGYFDPLQLQPFIPSERNHVYGAAIQVRANWEVVIDWADLK